MSEENRKKKSLEIELIYNEGPYYTWEAKNEEDASWFRRQCNYIKATPWRPFGALFRCDSIEFSNATRLFWYGLSMSAVGTSACLLGGLSVWASAIVAALLFTICKIVAKILSDIRKIHRCDLRKGDIYLSEKDDMAITLKKDESNQLRVAPEKEDDGPEEDDKLEETVGLRTERLCSNWDNESNFGDDKSGIDLNESFDSSF